MAEPADVKVIGHLSDRDWTEILQRIKLAFGVGPSQPTPDAPPKQ
jgi:hypothetical protein